MNTLATPNPNSTLQQPQEPVKKGFVLWLLTLWFVLVGVLFAWLFSYARVSLGTPIQAVILGKGSVCCCHAFWGCGAFSGVKAL